MSRNRLRRTSGTWKADPSILLLGKPLDPSIEPGAKNAVRTCLGVRPEDRVVLIVEAGLETLASPFFRELQAVGAQVEVFVVDVEQCAQALFVDRVVDRLSQATVSLLLSSMSGLPASFRRAVIAAPGERRHGHMPGISASMLQQSMRADFEEVHRLGERLIAVLGRGGTLTVSTPRGTALTVKVGTRYRWHNESGILRTPGWMNLPAGELLTVPESLDGELVPDGGIWDPHGELVDAADRLCLKFVGGRLLDVEERKAGASMRWLDRLDTYENGRQVGQIGFGTNTGILTAVGTLLQDLKKPDFHVTLGHTAPEHTGASWTCDVEVPLLMRRADVDFEGTPILRAGRFVPELAG